MQTTLEQRVADLEKQVEELRQRESKRSVGPKDWQQAVGMVEDSPFAREAVALGEAYRRSQTQP